MSKLWAEFQVAILAGAFYLFALAAQVSGYISATSGVWLFALAAVFLVAGLWPYDPTLAVIAGAVATLVPIWLGWNRLLNMWSKFPWRLRAPWVRKDGLNNRNQPAGKSAGHTGGIIATLPPSDGSTTSLAELAHERAKKGEVAPPVHIPMLAAVSRQLTPYEVDTKLRAVDEVLQLLREDMPKFAGEGGRLKDGAWYAFKDPDLYNRLVEGLTAFREAFEKSTQKLNALRSKYPEYADIIEATTMPHQAPALGEEAGKFLVHFHDLWVYLRRDATPNSFFNLLLQPRTSAFAQALADFAKWHEQAVNRLVTMRKVISR